MPSVETLLAIAPVVLTLGALAAGITIACWLAMALLRRMNMPAWFVSAAGVCLAATAIIACMLGLIIAFGAVANAEASSKATRLARGITEVVSCMPFATGGTLVAIAGVSWLGIWSWRHRSPAKPLDR